ncbi:MAG TPA: hypothetical protein VGA04_34570 [Streptosporangiaceae bacterium]
MLTGAGRAGLAALGAAGGHAVVASKSGAGRDPAGGGYSAGIEVNQPPRRDTAGRTGDRHQERQRHPNGW